MPELPEVEVTRRLLAPHVVGRRIHSVRCGPLSITVAGIRRRSASPPPTVVEYRFAARPARSLRLTIATDGEPRNQTGRPDEGPG